MKTRAPVRIRTSLDVRGCVERMRTMLQAAERGEIALLDAVKVSALQCTLIINRLDLQAERTQSDLTSRN